MLPLFRLFFFLCETSPKNGMQFFFFNLHFYIESNSIILITGGLPVRSPKDLAAFSNVF